jgi:hypothetical protein
MMNLAPLLFVSNSNMVSDCQNTKALKIDNKELRTRESMIFVFLYTLEDEIYITLRSEKLIISQKVHV